MIVRFLFAGSIALGVSMADRDAHAVGVNADIVFVVDSSGSMGGEFTFLAGAVGGFLSDLQADSRIDTARAGLITYETAPTLVSNLTTDVASLSSAFSGVRTTGGTENAYIAVDSALPGGRRDFGLDYDPTAVKSVVLITDERADDRRTYANLLGRGEAGLGAYLDDVGFLNNIILRLDTSAVPDFDGIARPKSGLFSVDEFRNNRDAFFDAFTATKIREIIEETPGIPGPGPTPPGEFPPENGPPGSPPSESPPESPPTAVIPLPATLPLLLAGLLGIGLAGRRRASASV